MYDTIISCIDTRSELISGGQLNMYLSVVEFPDNVPVFGTKVGIAKI